MALPESEVGSTANSYVILAKLATGGMAELFLARNATGAGVERYVVLKRALKHRTTDAAFVEMFLDEAKLATQLQHPNIAQVHDTGVLGDSYFFTMEYVHGETVRDIQQRTRELGRPLPIEAALTIIAGAASGLHHAHERRGLDGKPLGIVHRDVSPSNLMVSYEGTVKVVDFGIAKATHRATETQAGTVKGKISYLSPEQCRGRQMDRRSDLFSLGIVMWELLVGDRLFKRTSDYENMEAIAYQAIPPPSQVRAELPRDIEAIVMKLLAKSPNDRYQTAAALLEEVEQAAVRHAMPLSSASLGRLVRELFGQRLEPWVQMQAREPATEVTVTAAPGAHVTVTPIAPVAGSPEVTVTAGRATDFDSLVARIPDLSAHARVGESDPQVAVLTSRRRWPRLLATGLAGAALGAGLLALVRSDDPNTRPSPTVVPSPAAVVPAAVPDAAVAVDVAASTPGETPQAALSTPPVAPPGPRPHKPKLERPKPKPTPTDPPRVEPTRPKARNCDDDPLSCRR